MLHLWRVVYLGLVCSLRKLDGLFDLSSVCLLDPILQGVEHPLVTLISMVLSPIQGVWCEDSSESVMHSSQNALAVYISKTFE